MTETLPTLRPASRPRRRCRRARRGACGVTTTCSARSTCSMPERVLAAARSIRTGNVFALNPSLTLPDPPLFGRARVRHEVTGELGGGHDDLYHDWNTQSSAQWDGFRHFAHREHGHYGGVPDQEHGIHFWAERGIVGRAVLADVGALARAGRADRSVKVRATRSPPTTSRRASPRRAPPSRPATSCCMRTGWMAWYRALDADGARRLRERADGAEPGPRRARRARACCGTCTSPRSRPTTRPSR